MRKTCLTCGSAYDNNASTCPLGHAAAQKKPEFQTYNYDIFSHKARTLAKANAEAAIYCQEHGLDTREKMMDFIRTGLIGLRATHGNLDWARRILAREAAGDRLYPISVSKAREALNMPERQPGEEG